MIDRYAVTSVTAGRETADPADHPEQQERRECHHVRDDLVIGQRRNEQADRQEAAAEQQQPDTRQDRLPLGIAVDEQHAVVDQRDRQHHTSTERRRRETSP